jgi:hypothetical protein
VSFRGQRYSLRQRVKSEELRHELSLKMSAVRSDPDALWRVLCQCYSLGYGHGWSDQETDQAVTLPPEPSEEP